MKVYLAELKKVSIKILHAFGFRFQQVLTLYMYLKGAPRFYYCKKEHNSKFVVNKPRIRTDGY